MMKLAFSLVLFSIAVFANPPSSVPHATPVASSGEKGLISGFDDVLRQAEVQNLSNAALRLFAPSEGFAGMPLLYKHLSSEGFSVVSGITTWYTDNAEEFLTKEKYPPFQLKFRNWFLQWSIENFKMQEISQILMAAPTKKYVFVFDNSEPSQQIAKRLQKEYAPRTLAIYLRETVHQDPVAGTRSFITAFDVAAAEYKDHRLTASQVNSIAEVILKEKNFERIVPLFAYCPTTTASCSELAYELQRKCNAVAKRVVDGCTRRAKSLSEATASNG